MIQRIIFVFFIILVLFRSKACESQGINKEAYNFLEIPFICVHPCKRETDYGNISTSKIGSDVVLIFSSKNSENSFLGYNIWYGNQDELKKAHEEKSLKYVLNNTSSSNENTILKIDSNEIGENKGYPTIYTTGSLKEVVYYVVLILNVKKGKIIYLTSTNGYVNSKFSNPYVIP